MKSGRRRNKFFHRRFGALFWISFLLLSSAVLRLGMEAGPAIAREAEKSYDESIAAEANQSTQARVVPEDLERLIRELQIREEAVRERERRVEDRMKALQIADEALEKKMAALIEVERSLSETLALADGASETDLERLTEVYEKMKPKEAAALFETMDATFAAGFLSRMQPNAAAGIMAKLTPQAAYTISVILAGRNAEVPKE